MKSPFTGSILDSLKMFQVKATFHPTAANLHIDNFAKSARRAFAEGHVIGLRFEPSLDPRRMEEHDLQRELAKQSRAVYEVIGKHPKFIRL
jgi:peptidoglycan/xylan/chitin deacetylase (PgdA/CDA1 family)